MISRLDFPAAVTRFARAGGGSFTFSLSLTGAAALALCAISLPFVYLMVRAANIGVGEIWSLAASARGAEVLFNSLSLAAGVAALSFVLAAPLAFLTALTDLPARRLWTIVAILPLSVPSYVGSFALIAAFAPRGSLLQELLAPLGVEELPSIYGWPGSVLAISLFSYPYLLLTLRAGLEGIDPATEEAARSLGLSRRAAFFRVLLPQLRPSLVAGLLLVSLYALRDFGTPSLMRFESFTRVIYWQYTLSFNRDRAAALALIFVAVVFAILWLERRARTRAAYFTPGSQRQGGAPVIRLGAWKWPAVAFCTGVAALSLALPAAVSLLWLARGAAAGLIDAATVGNMLHAAWRSFFSSGLAALAVSFFVLPVAMLAVRGRSRLVAAVERWSYLAFGLPSIVTALALVFFGARHAPQLYQTLPMLIFAYFVLFFPQALGPVRGSLMQIDPRLEESARSLGRSPWRAFREAALPLAWPGLTTGTLLVFLTTIKELPATLLLAPIGFDTLASRIWKATEDVRFAEAAAGSLTMICVCAALILAVMIWGRGELSPDPGPTVK